MRRSGVRIPLAPPQADIRSGCRFFVCSGALVRCLVVVLLVAPLVFRASHVLSCGPGCSVCPWAAARPLAVRAASFARRVGSKPGQAPPPPTGTAARPCHRPRAPQPGPAAAHRYGGALRTLRRPPHRRRLVADVLLGASARSPARPRHHPPAPRPGLAALHAVGAAGIRDRACCLRLRWCSGHRRARPPARSLHASLRLGVVDLEARPCPPVPSAPSTPIEPGVLMCGSVCRFDVRPRPAIAHEHRGRRLT